METTYNYQQLPLKQQRLMDAAQELFCAHGVRRVTVQEICENANVSKMTYYKYFTNKWGIARSVLDCLFAQGIAMYHEMVGQEIPFNQKVEMILTLTKSRVHAVGSAFMNDLMDEASPLYGYFMEKQKKTRELSIDFFRQAQEDGFIQRDIQIPVLLFMLDRLSDLIDHPDFISMVPDIEERASVIATMFFRGFSGAPDETVTEGAGRQDG